MPKLRSLFGLPMFAVDSGRQIGKVEEIIIDNRMAAVEAILTAKPEFPREGQDILPLASLEENLYGVFFANLFSVGADAVMVRFEKDLKDLSLFCRAGSFYYSSLLLDKPVYTDTGFSLGILADIIFDAATGEINTYQISDGIFFDILYGRRLMPPPRTQVVGEKALIVPDSMEKLVYYADGADCGD